MFSIADNGIANDRKSRWLDEEVTFTHMLLARLISSPYKNWLPNNCQLTCRSSAHVSAQYILGYA